MYKVHPFRTRVDDPIHPYAHTNLESRQADSSRSDGLPATSRDPEITLGAPPEVDRSQTQNRANRRSEIDKTYSIPAGASFRGTSGPMPQIV